MTRPLREQGNYSFLLQCMAAIATAALMMAALLALSLKATGTTAVASAGIGVAAAGFPIGGILIVMCIICCSLATHENSYSHPRAPYYSPRDSSFFNGSYNHFHPDANPYHGHPEGRASTDATVTYLPFPPPY